MVSESLTSYEAEKNHRWKFRRVGGLDLVELESAEDIRHLPTLDQKLWTALACPVKGLEFDEKTLSLIDTDGDGRVRAPEIMAAVAWVCVSLQDPAKLLEERASLPLAEIEDDALARSARRILQSLEKADASEISVVDAGDTRAIFSRTVFNGDGVIIPESAGDDETVKQVIEEIIATEGSIEDRSGKPGVDLARIESFFADLTAYEAWIEKRESSPEVILPLGAETASALAAVEAVRTKVDDYFARTRLAFFDERAIAALNRQESEFLSLAAKDLTISNEEIRAFPLARIEPSKPLPLGEGINPAWADAVQMLSERAVGPLFGNDLEALTEAQWNELKAKLAPFQEWAAAKGGERVEPLGIDRVREIRRLDPRASMEALMQQDLEVAEAFDAILAVEKLVRFNRDLYRLLLNFVSFADFYAPDRMAVFQAGTLYLDSRACDLVVRVDNPAKHAALAGLAKAYLAYCECTRPSTNEKMTIAAAFMNGDSDRLMVGRNGVFYDRKGRDWDATIVRVVENPISLREAFWAPYKKFVRMLEERVAKRAAAADAASTQALSGAANQAADPGKAEAAESKRLNVGTVAAIAVAVSGIVAVLTVIIGGLLGMVWWQYPIALVCMLLFISGPSMIIAALKLRQRNLGPILDACGWAVNGRVKINLPFGATLTRMPQLPAGSSRRLNDPYARRRSAWTWVWGILVLVLLGAALAGVFWDRSQRKNDFTESTDVESGSAMEAPASPPPADSP